MSQWQDFTTGERIKMLRGKETQTDLAERSGLSKHTIQKAEQDKNVSLPTLLRLAEALHSDVSVILGQQAPRRGMGRDDRSMLRELSRTVHDTAAGVVADPAEGAAPGQADLAEAADRMWRVYWRGAYAEAGSLVAPFLRSVALFAQAAPAGQEAVASGLLSDAYRAAGLIANFLGARDLAYASVGHALRHAELAADPVRVSMLGSARARVLLRDARVEQALREAEAAAARAEPRFSEQGTGLLAAYGKNITFAAVAASRLGDANRSADLLSQAHAVAARLGRDVFGNGMQFGPSYAGAQAVGINVTLGNTGKAIDLSRRFDPSGLTQAAHSRMQLDIALAQADARQWETSLDTLLEVCSAHPEWAKHQAIPGVIIQRAGRAGNARIRKLSEILGTSPTIR
ncbi:helix-turn-helix transcriptional regulator [Streptomyces erythrochromogenes]|uniref:helix-turn-helix transcriptional regulator n=1 Tax=Streptomyces erythrochromogenes TaxID=285574 RepID=UPI00340567BB